MTVNIIVTLLIFWLHKAPLKKKKLHELPLQQIPQMAVNSWPALYLYFPSVSLMHIPQTGRMKLTSNGCLWIHGFHWSSLTFCIPVPSQTDDSTTPNMVWQRYTNKSTRDVYEPDYDRISHKPCCLLHMSLFSVFSTVWVALLEFYIPHGCLLLPTS